MPLHASADSVSYGPARATRTATRAHLALGEEMHTYNKQQAKVGAGLHQGGEWVAGVRASRHARTTSTNVDVPCHQDGREHARSKGQQERKLRC